jgi:hypothetical protein
MNDPCIGDSLVNLGQGRGPAMPQKTYRITLRDEEREQREPLLHSGPHARRQVTRARMLLTAANMVSARELSIKRFLDCFDCLDEVRKARQRVQGSRGVALDDGTQGV